MQRRLEKNQSGFSLIELMIVIGAIGILSTMAVPQFNKYAATARQAEVKTNLRTIDGLVETWVLANNTHMGAATGPFYRLTTQSGGGCAPNFCNVANGLGFVIPDCFAARYNYVYHPVLKLSMALENGGAAGSCYSGRQVFVGCPDAGTKDQWRHYVEQDGGIFQAADGSSSCP